MKIFIQEIQKITEYLILDPDIMFGGNKQYECVFIEHHPEIRNIITYSFSSWHTQSIAWIELAIRNGVDLTDASRAFELISEEDFWNIVFVIYPLLTDEDYKNVVERAKVHSSDEQELVEELLALRHTN